MKSNGTTLAVLDAIIRLTSGSVESAVTASEIRTLITDLEANYLSYLVKEKYLTFTYKNGDTAYVLLPKALDYVLEEKQQKRRDILLWASLIFAAIAAMPIILQTVKLFLSLRLQ